ncbi:MAG: NAD(P)-binding domain-containing protein [Alphaproteobacteria bacterium]|nr:NAD(P)-binding domain-containing protein [Alphaproteobacteria bacterium]MBV9552827.1 NAD(P)-binding domain-containing protein [Alphaproteobacteria bacterium]
MTNAIVAAPHRRHMLSLIVAAVALPVLPHETWAQAAGSGDAVKLGFIGSGREGGALGTLFAKKGHPVMFSSRHPETLKELVASAGPAAKAGTVEEAVAFGDAIVLVVPYTAVEQIGKEYGKQIAAKRLLLDVSNPIPRRDGEDLVKQVNEMGGAGLATAKFIPGAKIVRGFNAIGSGKLEPDAAKTDGKVGVPIAGDDRGAIDLAEALIREIGFEPVLVGGLAMGKHLVPGTPLGGEHSPEELRQIAATLKA